MEKSIQNSCHKLHVFLLSFLLIVYFLPFSACDTVPSYPQPSLSAIEVKVVKVIDGDTINVQMEDREESVVQSVRYIGIDAPEVTHVFSDTWISSEPYGVEAAEKNSKLVDGKTVILERDISITDSYGRLLGYVWVDNIFVNAELVRLGLARAAVYPPDTKYAELFWELEKLAKNQKRGIWD